MEARKLKTVDDLLQSDDERVELIDGEIVKRPMARCEHALIQSRPALGQVLRFATPMPFAQQQNGRI